MKNILIVDDNPLNNEKYISPLRDKYKVDVEMTIDGAIYDLENFHYDLIVIDIMMPMQGISAKNELSTGLYFYREKVQRIRPNLETLFWSNLPCEPFNIFFKDEKKREHIHFLQKDKEIDNHLLNKIDSIFI